MLLTNYKKLIKYDNYNEELKYIKYKNKLLDDIKKQIKNIECNANNYLSLMMTEGDFDNKHRKLQDILQYNHIVKMINSINVLNEHDNIKYFILNIIYGTNGF